MRKLIISAIICGSVISISGCSLSVTKPQDAGVWFSNTNGEQWEQRIFVDQQKKKLLTIGSLDIGYFVFHPTDTNILYASTKESGIYYTINKGAQWQKTKLVNGWYPSFAIDPTTPVLQYAATGSSIIKSADSGQTWTNVYVDRPGISVTSLAVDPISSNRIWAGNSAGTLFRSDDYGQTWKLITIFSDSIHKIIIPEITNEVMYIWLSAQGLTKSLDGGTTWDASITTALSSYSGALPIRSFYLRPFTSTDIVLGTNYGILHTVDGGISWKQIPTVIPTSSVPISFALIDPINPNKVMFIAANTFYISDDKGATWKTLKTIPTSQVASILTVNPAHTEDMFIGVTKVKK